MTSRDDLHYWKEELGDIKKLDERNYHFEHKDFGHFDKLAEKIRKENRKDEKRVALPKVAKSYPSDFKLRKGKSLGLDRTTDKKLKAGKLPIDLRVDLHGLSLEDAYFKLKDTIDYAFEEGYRLVLAITGKGSHSAEGQETIRSSLEKWLSYPELSGKIIKYVDAHKRHGGKGAVYVLLKRLKIEK